MALEHPYVSVVAFQFVADNQKFLFTVVVCIESTKFNLGFFDSRFIRQGIKGPPQSLKHRKKFLQLLLDHSFPCDLCV